MQHLLRFYIQNGDGYARLWRIQETKTSRDPFALTINLHGLTATDSTLVGRWPPQSYSNTRLADGHDPPYLDRLRKTSPQGPLTPTSPRTIQFHVLSDRAERYRLREARPKEPACVLPASDGEVVLMTTWVSGSDYDLESEVRREVGHLPVHEIKVGTWDSLKVAFVRWREKPPPAAFHYRTDGTIVSLRTNQPDGEGRIISYAFA